MTTRMVCSMATRGRSHSRSSAKTIISVNPPGAQDMMEEIKFIPQKRYMISPMASEQRIIPTTITSVGSRSCPSVATISGPMRAPTKAPAQICTITRAGFGKRSRPVKVLKAAVANIAPISAPAEIPLHSPSSAPAIAMEKVRI